MKEELKTCPFCGNEEHFSIDFDIDIGASWYICCHDCGCHMYGDTEAEAIKAWNTRKPPDPWDHISPEYREGVTYTLHVDIYGRWYIKNDLLSGTAAARGEMCDPGRNGEKKIVREGVWI